MLTSIIYYINFATTGMFMSNNMKTKQNQSKITERERERKCSYASNCLAEFVIPWPNDQTGQ